MKKRRSLCPVNVRRQSKGKKASATRLRLKGASTVVHTVFMTLAATAAARDHLPSGGDGSQLYKVSKKTVPSFTFPNVSLSLCLLPYFATDPPASFSPPTSHGPLQVVIESQQFLEQS